MKGDLNQRARQWLFILGGFSALLILIAVVGTLWPQRKIARTASSSPPPLPLPAETNRSPQPILFNEFITTDTRNWGDVPSGEVVCQEVPFACQGAIRLNGLRASREGKKYPGAVLGIPVQRRGARLHLLHAAENWSGMTEGAPYGKMVLHYANGDTRAFYLLFRIHGLDWFGGPNTPNETVADPNTRLGWAFRKPDGAYRRFFHTTFTNPLPEVEIVSADFVSPLEGANLWLFGFTVSDQVAALAPEVDMAQVAAQRIPVTLRLRDASGRAVTNGSVTWRAIGFDFRMEFPPFPSDAQGGLVLDMPRRSVWQVAFSATAPDGSGCVGIVERDAAGEFPAEEIVQLAANGAGAQPPVLAPPPPDKPSTFHVIDLKPYSRKTLDAYTNNWWMAFPRGPTNFDGVPFQLGGKVELFGIKNARTLAPYLHAVEIPLGRRFARMHCLQAPMPSTADGTPYAKLVLRYADGQSHTLRLVYGVHGRDPWRHQTERFSGLEDPNTAIVWEGEAPQTVEVSATLRLFKTVLANPRPDVEVTNLLLASMESDVSGIFMGLTLEENAALPVLPAVVEAKTDLPWRDELALAVVDAATGAPVRESKVVATAQERGNTLQLGGPFQRDAASRIRVPYSPAQYSALRLEVSAPGYASAQETVQGTLGAWPREWSVKLAKAVAGGER